MTDDDGLIGAYALDGRGGGRALDWAGVREKPEGILWMHLDRGVPGCREWLRSGSGLDPLVAEALLAEETRPRATPHGAGLILNLRGVNLNPGANPEDMVSIRVWVEERRVVSVRHRRLMAVQDLRDDLEAGRGPKDVGDIIVGLAGKLVARMEPMIADLDDRVDTLEDEILTAQRREMRVRLGALRREAIALRRYVGPQREALAQLLAHELAWLGPAHRGRLREVADRVTRYVEDLDSARERAAAVQDELSGLLAERMERTMYMLAIVATIFLPLGLITGLLGINVGGIPGADTPWAFAIVCVMLAALGVFEYWLFRRLKWI